MFYSRSRMTPSPSTSTARRTAARGPSLAVLALASAVASGCAKDVILPVDSTCGDFKRQGNEECDIDSEGCVNCHVARGWTCTDDTCTATCGDSVAVAGEECDPPDGVTCDSSCRVASKAEACDMTGYWIARQTDFSIDTVLQQVQTSTNWYLYKLVQTGAAFQVDKAINCGIHVTGSATADLTDPGVRGLIHLNPQDTDSPRGPRKGTFGASGDGCTFAFDRNYMIRGGEAALLPTVFTTKPDLATLAPLPSESDPEKPTKTNLTGSVDVDGDGQPGVAIRITGNANGVRHVVQRDWNEYFMHPGHDIPANAIEFVAAVRFDNQENLLAVSRCPPIGCGILTAQSHPDINRQDRVTFYYLGKDLAEPRVAAVITAELKADIEADLAGCTNAREALPHDPSMQ